ncbi:MAG: HU family DNA-binding protein [Holosporales bacterium]|jgi:DNA-binding protein HU-beta|nr:HU family DNA-binding protein [Holosporales bacterium]
MNRVELVSSIANVTELRKTDVDKMLGAFVDTVKIALADGEDVRLIGFGTFFTVHRDASEGRNMRTGEPMQIPARDIPKFKPGKQLKDAVARRTK